VRSRAIDRLRSRRPVASESEHVLATVASPRAESPAWRLEEKQRALTLRQTMARLPGSVRRMMEMSYYQGLSHAEIAAGTGEPLGTVKTRIRRGLQLMREALAGGEFAMLDRIPG
jgi:RNA polymerase sigma-70 factor, ECF subfamily